MKFKSNEKYNTIAVYSVGIFAICLTLVAIVFKYSSFLKYVAVVAEVFAPILWGIIIAFILNPIMKFFEKYLGKLINKRKPHPKILRMVSVVISLALLLTVLISLVAGIIPQIIESVKSIFMNMDSYLATAQDWVDKRIEENEFLRNMVEGEFVSIKQYSLNFMSTLQQKMDLVSSIAERGISILVTLKDFALGLILATYMLASKETFMAQGKKVLYAIIPHRRCNTVMTVMRRVNDIFTHFLSGKALDSFIIGLLTFIVLTFADIPYVVLISLIIGVTNMIPFFGPFIGAIPCSFLVFFAKPDMTIFFVIFILILQQFDGNFLGPLILGDTLGISAFWIMVAILISGGLFGFIGMVFAVPVFAVFYTLFKDLIESRLRKKLLPIESDSYRNHGNIEVIDINAGNSGEKNETKRADNSDDTGTDPEADSGKKEKS